MEDIVQKIIKAQKHAMSIRPKIGGFPVLAEVLRQAGVEMNRWALPSCQSIFITKEGAMVQQGNPLFSGAKEIPNFNRESLIAAIRTDQEGKSTFPEFLESAWKAGVIGYDVDFVSRKVIYYGANGDQYVESYPAVG